MSNTNTKPKRKYAADYDGNPAVDETTTTEATETDSAAEVVQSSNSEPSYVVIAGQMLWEWAQNHPRISVTVGIILLLIILAHL